MLKPSSVMPEPDPMKEPPGPSPPVSAFYVQQRIGREVAFVLADRWRGSAYPA